MRRLAGAALAVALGVMIAPGAHAAEGEETIWLCKPGVEPNPCAESLETTVYSAEGDSHVENPPLAAHPRIDCFYVYPTVSQQPSANSDREVEEQQTAIAQYQANRFSQRCRMFAPMYRQRTLAAINGPPEQNAAALALAFEDIRSAWRDYLKSHNGRRGVVLIGHSQGTTMLRQLIRTEIDAQPRIRKRIVSALLLGGNVTVRKGARAGGDFANVPTCTGPRQTGCVVAYSVYNEPPPSNSRFGRPPASSSPPFNFPAGPEYEVACTNPASLRDSGAAAPISTYLRSEPFPGLLGVLLIEMYGGPPPSAPTPWLQPQDHYTAHCSRDADAHVLMIEPLGSARKLNAAPEPSWGLHLADVNIALGDLVDLVGVQEQVYLKKLRRSR